MIPSNGIQEQIDDYWQNHRHCTYIRKHASPELLDFLEQQVKEHPWFETEYNALSFAARHIYEPVRCKACGKVLRLDNAREHKEYCSGKCAANSMEVKEKARRTMQEHYGCDAPAQCKEIRDRQRATMKERYGAEYTLSSKILTEKQTKTVLEKYGVDKIGKSKEVHGKARNTVMEKYGVEHYAKTNEFREQSSILNRKKGYALLGRWKDYVVPLFSEEEYEGMQGEHYGKVYRWKCVKCGTEFDFSSHNTGVHSELGTCFPTCPNCYKKGTVSFGELQLLDYIKSIYTGEVVENAHNVIRPYELDIYLPEKHLAIEFDGLYWHSEEKGKNRMYHANKTRMCEEHGIHLLHVFEDEWIDHEEIVKDRIRSVLGVGQNRIFARNCDVREIDSHMSNEFLDANHLQGGDNAPIRYGLFHNNELVSVMTFGKPRFSSSYDYEMIRFASRIGVNVVGGASKLLVYFKRNHSGTIVSYADRRYSNGSLYEKLGFTLDHVSSPNYWWFKSKTKLGRYECQKHLLSKLLGDGFIQEQSESENMIRNGYRRIYDCGNIVYVYGESK